MIGLRFILKGGSFLLVVVPDAVAREIIEGFAVGSPRRETIRDDACSWSVQTDQIQAVHTVPLEQYQESAPPKSPVGSGFVPPRYGG